MLSYILSYIRFTLRCFASFRFPIESKSTDMPLLPEYKTNLYELMWLKHHIKNNKTSDSISEEEIDRYENILQIISNVIARYMQIKMEKEFSDDNYVLQKFFCLKPPYTTKPISHILYYPCIYFDRYFYFQAPTDSVHDTFSLELIESYEYMVYTISNVEEGIVSEVEVEVETALDIEGCD